MSAVIVDGLPKDICRECRRWTGNGGGPVCGSCEPLLARVAEMVAALVDLRGVAETLYIRSRTDESDPEMKRAIAVIGTANKVIDASAPSPSVGTPQSHEEIMGEPKDSANMPSKTPPQEIAQSHRKPACATPSSPSSPSTPSSESEPRSTSGGASEETCACTYVDLANPNTTRRERYTAGCPLHNPFRADGPRPSDARAFSVGDRVRDTDAVGLGFGLVGKIDSIAADHARDGNRYADIWWERADGTKFLNGRPLSKLEHVDPCPTEPTVKHTGPCRLTCAVCEPRPDYPSAPCDHALRKQGDICVYPFAAPSNGRGVAVTITWCHRCGALKSSLGDDGWQLPEASAVARPETARPAEPYTNEQWVDAFISRRVDRDSPLVAFARDIALTAFRAGRGHELAHVGYYTTVPCPVRCVTHCPEHRAFGSVPTGSTGT